MVQKTQEVVCREAARVGSQMNDERLIVALDVSSAREALELVNRIGPAAGVYKVGLQLFTSEGPELVRELVRSGRQVFLDLKLHDIPNTVAKAVEAALRLQVKMLTIHASGGTEMLRAATEAAQGRVLLLGVTVLTSMNDDSLGEIGVSGMTADQVLRLAGLAKNAGLRGVVASPAEARNLRKSMGEGLVIVTPGIRPAGSAKDDQQRIATPGDAIASGANYIVVGRPITGAADPSAAAQAVVAEMSQAVAR